MAFFCFELLQISLSVFLSLDEVEDEEQECKKKEIHILMDLVSTP